MDFYINVPPPVYLLEAAQAFDALNATEKEYVYAIYQASWVGGLIDLIQTSPESAGLFLLLQYVLSNQTLDSVIEVARAGGFSTDEVDAVLSYFASVCGNLGNYKSFGDTKFVPSISRSRFVEFFSLTNSFKSGGRDTNDLLSNIIDPIYSLHARRLRLGFGPSDGLTTYYSSNCTREDAEVVQNYLKSINFEAENTRLVKDTTTKTYTVCIASADEKMVECLENLPLSNGYSVNLKYGDMSALMKLLAKSSREVVEYALNAKEKQMWSLYADSFTSGSVKQHKDASKLWVDDKDPAVESYIGFIESYRDPFGVRAEFESFVAVVNKAVSEKFQNLVQNAEPLLTNLPWPPAYERDTFRRPDFTSLDVVTFASTGIPLGINIPNYNELREGHGFKNVSLGNVQSAHFQDPSVNFLSDTDRPIYHNHILTSMDVGVALHELLGHGSGKLFQRSSDGSFNFNPNTVDLLTGGSIQNWYEPGETWDSKFTHMSSAMEECRAECVSLYLSDLPEVLRIFGVDDNTSSRSTDVSDVTYINWINMILGGVRAMEFYTPSENSGDRGAWRQAHCCARYVILRVLLEADKSMLRLDQVIGSDGAPDLIVKFDRSKLISVAKPAIGNFLKTLQYYKSTGNVKDGVPFFLNYAELPLDHLELRKIVIDRKRPRPIFLQPHLRKTQDNSVELVTYETNYGGVIQSFVDRFKDISHGPEAVAALRQVWDNDKMYFSDIPV